MMVLDRSGTHPTLEEVMEAGEGSGCRCCASPTDPRSPSRHLDVFEVEVERLRNPSDFLRKLSREDTSIAMEELGNELVL